MLVGSHLEEERIHENQQVLEYAMENIKQLQNSLSYMIEENRSINEVNMNLQIRIREQQRKHKQREQGYQRQIKILKDNNRQHHDTFEETKTALEQYEAQLREKADELTKSNRIIYEQKQTIMQLENELYKKASNQSLIMNETIIMEKSQIINQLNHENNGLKMELKKCKDKLDKRIQESKKLDEQIKVFKIWLGRITGVGKVVKGCEELLMNQISHKLNGEIFN